MPAREAGASERESESEKERERVREETEEEERRTEDVQTELDTIRKSILRRWYAVKIILVSPARLSASAGGGWWRDGGGTVCVGRGRVPDTKTVRFGISQNLWYACIWREQTRTVLYDP